MEYYSVMIVDDEEEVREGIIRRMDWKTLGFQVVDSAENGEDALEKAEKLCPDVVLTDIQMPFMDGITFCKKLKERIYGTRIVIFSGYDEFEYAKEAIKLEAEEYILKPIDTLELQAVFKRIKERLDEERDQKKNRERLEMYYQESLPLLQQKFMISLLEGNVLSEEIDNFKRLYQLDMEAPYYVAGLLQIEGMAADTKTNLMLMSLQQIMEENLEKELRVHCVNYLDTVAVIAMLREKAELTVFIQALDKICKMASKLLEVNLSGGIGNLCRELTGLNQSCKEAQTAMEYRILMGVNQAIFIQDIEPNAGEGFIIGEKEIQTVIRDIKLGTPEDIEKTIRGHMKKLEQARVSMAALQSYFMEMAVEITRLSRVYELDEEQTEGMSLYFQSSVTEFESLQMMGERLITICLNLRKQIRRERTDTAKLLIEKAKQHIQETYSDPEISVERLCHYLNLSPTYFSTLFKKETGMSFVNYLTQVRMEEAVKLLNTTEEKAYIISEMVGYMDPNYFSYVFKKLYGISPSRYRVNRGE